MEEFVKEIDEQKEWKDEKLDKLKWNEPLSEISLPWEERFREHQNEVEENLITMKECRETLENEFEKASEKLNKLHNECLQANEHERDFLQIERER